MPAYVSLFKGINVGGNHQVKMADLKALHESLGLTDVLPYIQSGNVVFKSEDTDPTHLRQQIEESFETTFGFRSAVMLRSLADLQAIIDTNPFQNHPDKEPKWIAVMFLSNSPDETARQALLTSYNGPEEIYITGQNMYIYYPDGVGRSKLTTPLIEKKLKTIGTGRNWNTVLQLQTLLAR